MTTATNCPNCHHDTHKAAQCSRCNCGISEISHPTQNTGTADTKLEYVHVGGRQWTVNRGHRVKPCKRAEDLDK